MTWHKKIVVSGWHEWHKKSHISLKKISVFPGSALELCFFRHQDAKRFKALFHQKRTAIVIINMGDHAYVEVRPHDEHANYFIKKLVEFDPTVQTIVPEIEALMTLSASEVVHAPVEPVSFFGKPTPYLDKEDSPLFNACNVFI